MKSGKLGKVRRLAIDACMVGLFLAALAYRLTGNHFHEWTGLAFLSLLAVHLVQHWRWKWLTSMNSLLFTASLLFLGSAMFLSREIFVSLGLNGGIQAQKVHLCAAYWVLILSSIHIGLYWDKVITGNWRKNKILQAATVPIVLYGMFAFRDRDIALKLLGYYSFDFWDYDKPVIFFFIDYLSIIGLCIWISRYILEFIRKKTMKITPALSFTLMLPALFVVFSGVFGCAPAHASPTGFVLIKGGSFRMGSPASELFREKDETAHQVMVSDFMMATHELTQHEYREITGNIHSEFKGNALPVENVTWYEALAYCNARSVREGLTPAYTMDGENVRWNRGANGYRLPTEAEWEYAARSNTTSPFPTGNNVTTRLANFYGTYPYLVEKYYFSSLPNPRGEYREKPVPVGSFAPNAWGLYDMQGNVREWCWDGYGEYAEKDANDPIGTSSGTYKVNRGGGWNDFGRHLRSAYRAAYPPENRTFNLGFRLVRNADGVANNGVAESIPPVHAKKQGKVLVAYFTESGNTQHIARLIHQRVGGDLVRLELARPYSRNYNTLLEEAAKDMENEARPPLKTRIADFVQYDVIYLGYPNYWASIPMPIASFLEQYDFSGKIIVPFISHGGGRLGQTLSAIAKQCPKSTIKEALSVHYGGGSGLQNDMNAWLNKLGMTNKERSAR
jgi:formylglycine-generating enzyme required for sulfatase activity/flavodoxin